MASGPAERIPRSEGGGRPSTISPVGLRIAITAAPVIGLLRRRELPVIFAAAVLDRPTRVSNPSTADEHVAKRPGKCLSETLLRIVAPVLTATKVSREDKFWDVSHAEKCNLGARSPLAFAIGQRKPCWRKSAGKTGYRRISDFGQLPHLRIP